MKTGGYLLRCKTVRLLPYNNNREWYHANKEDFKKANAEFEEFLQALILEIGKFDSSILHNNQNLKIPVSDVLCVQEIGTACRMRNPATNRQYPP